MPFEEFRRIMTQSFPAQRDIFTPMVQKNRQRRALLRQASSFTRLSTVQVERPAQDNAKLVDVRGQVAFAPAFLPGPINIGTKRDSTAWPGIVADAGSQIIPVADSKADALEPAFRFGQVGCDRVVGYLANRVFGRAMQAEAPHQLPQLTPATLIRALRKRPDHLVLDVRADAQWQMGYIGGAIYKPASNLIARGIDPNKKRHTTAVCGSGHRGNIARRCLKSPGYKHVFEHYRRDDRAECRAQEPKYIEQGATA